MSDTVTTIIGLTLKRQIITMMTNLLRFESNGEMHVIRRRRGVTEVTPNLQRLLNRITKEIVSSIVMTSYNCRTYQVDDIDWSLNPTTTFHVKGVTTTFAEYYHKRYNLIIQDREQPMILSRPMSTVINFHLLT
ncbi:unnamed protein product [Orchesella dallaii]|uniref:PAZ domain-containing protein n=1 Tax=Orchesella dallaii TaxID=48710 RepID=A0ABP1Q297_9HEXA